MKRWMIILALLAMGSAVLHIWAEYHGPRIQIYVFKPLTMLFIIWAAIYRTRAYPSRYAHAIVAGLFCSVAGDVFLMLPSDQFIPGLISFLVAHLFYILAFTWGRPFRPSLLSPWPFAAYGILIYWVLSSHLAQMKLPVAVYIVVILAMAWTAWDRYTKTGRKSALIAFFGAVLFIISDSILAINRFREPFEAARALNLSTYFAAQYLIALSVDAAGASGGRDRGPGE
jgi:uncharacterized membrane protein YhhN